MAKSLPLSFNDVTQFYIYLCRQRKEENSRRTRGVSQMYRTGCNCSCSGHYRYSTVAVLHSSRPSVCLSVCLSAICLSLTCCWFWVTMVSGRKVRLRWRLSQCCMYSMKLKQEDQRSQSHACIVSKQLNISSKFFYHQIAHQSSFHRTNWLQNSNRVTRIRYDTIGEFNVDSKAEYSALSSTHSQKKKLKQTTPER